MIEVVRRPRQGLFLPEADLWLDPSSKAERAFISHAHADHVARNRLSLCSTLTAALIRVRYGTSKTGDQEVRALPWRTPVPWKKDWEIRLLPAGHIVGSAMLHLTRLSDGATLLYTGDYKLRTGLTAEPCELMPADTLIMETTFGLPRFVFPPLQATIEAVLHFVDETLAEGRLPLLLGYSLGKAQEILAILHQGGHPVMCHDSILKLMPLLQALPGMPECRPFDANTAQDHVLVFPPQSIRELNLGAWTGKTRSAMLSGWALEKSARFRYRVDAMFPLSDHADYPELWETVQMVRPRRIYTVHGHTREFAADLRRKGWEAWSLEREDQLELSLE